jgi:hypothetical protein
VTQNGVFSYDIDLNETHPEGRFPIDLGWASPGIATLTSVCHKPAYHAYADTTLSGCMGGEISYDLQSDNTTTYSWTLNGTIAPTQTSGILTIESLTTADTGTWVSTMTNVCGTTVAPPITVALHTSLPATISQTGMTLTATSADDYQWINCATNNPVNGATGQSFAPGANGNYAVITVNNGCEDTSACYTLSDLGLEAQTWAAGISVYPNPATDELQLLGTDALQLSVVKVISMTGQVMLTGNAAKIKLSGLQAGTYFIVVETSHGTWHGTFVKM